MVGALALAPSMFAAMVGMALMREQWLILMAVLPEELHPSDHALVVARCVFV